MRTLASLVAVAALALLSSPASALSVGAELSRARVDAGDQLVLSVTINGSGSATPRLPAIPNVEIYESGKSQSMSIINGRVSSSVVYTYVLAPRKAGRYTVPPIIVEGAAPTAPLPFIVDEAEAEPLPAAPAAPAPAPSAPAPAGPSAAAPAPSAQGPTPDVFVTATVDKPRAFVNEQVTLVVRFLTAVPLAGAPQYDAPKLAGLLAEPLGAESNGQTIIGGESTPSRSSGPRCSRCRRGRPRSGRRT
ncbi:MAG: BatD family protein [Elusimicrobiota bacterium]|nr:MAG: BatD family protein [Elusimicrobiota bacterium]